MSGRIIKNNQNEEKTTEDNQMTAGRSLTPPDFNLTAGSCEPPEAQEMATFPDGPQSEHAASEGGKEARAAAQMLKFLDHLDVILDLKEALTPSLLGTVKKVIKIREFVNSLSDVRKGASLGPEDAVGTVSKGTVKAVGRGIGFSYKAIDLTYWASVKGAKLVARGVWAAQEFAGQISEEQYENSVDNLDDSVPESLIGLALMPTKTYQNLRKIKRLSKTILDEFSALKTLKRSLQNGDASMADVVSTLTDLKGYLKDFLDLCEIVEDVIGDLGFDVDLKPVKTAIDKFNYPLKSMKNLIGEDQAKRKQGNDDAPEGGWPALKKSLEPGYMPVIDSLFG